MSQLGKKALLYISLYKQTHLANLLSCLRLWFAWLFKGTTSTVTCKCSILTTRQRMTNIYIGHWYVLKSFMVNTSLDVRFLELIVTPNPCPRHVCLMSVTIY